MDKLTIAQIQANITWHRPQDNFARFEELVSSVTNADIIILPEMWSSGFTMKAHLFHTDSIEAVNLMKNWSKQKQALIIGSLIVEENEKYFNRAYAVFNGEVIAQYDKRHLFAYAGEDRVFTPGKEKCIFEYKAWKFCLNICYDLRFPAWSRNLEDFDILLYTANWPDKRIKAWDTLSNARAIENQCYVIATNCVGDDAWHNHYTGHSSVIKYDGAIMNQLIDQEGVITTEIFREEMLAYRKNLPFLVERDQFKILD